MLKNDFNQILLSKISNPQTAGEVVCFSALMQALSKNNYVFLRQTHGGRGKVMHYLQHPHSIAHTQNCEIADILIIFVSRRKGIRYSFIQNKRDKRTPYYCQIPLKRVGVTPIQWDLLHYRCDVYSKGSIKFPQKCISNAILDSVATYGIFMNDQGALTVDMSYCIAKDMYFTTPGPIVSKGKRSVTIHTNYNKIRMNNGFSEILGVTTLDNFEVAGRAMLIGTPLLTDCTVVSREQQQISDYLLGVIHQCFLEKQSPYFQQLISDAFSTYDSSLIAECPAPCNLVIMEAYEEVIYVRNCDDSIKDSYIKSFFGDNIVIKNSLQDISRNSLYIIDDVFLQNEYNRLEREIRLMVGSNNCYVVKLIEEKMFFDVVK